MIKVMLETEFSGLDLQANICIEMKPQESIVSRGKRYKSGGKYKVEKREKGRIMETQTGAKSESLNSILQ